MKEGPNIAHIASLIGDPARANMLSALMGGVALTGVELAAEAGVAKATASGHLNRLTEGGLINATKQGRHRYYRLAGPDVAEALEHLMGLAEARGHRRVRTGPRDPALRMARVCYDHLAGDAGVRLYEALQRNGVLLESADQISLTSDGHAHLQALGIDVDTIASERRKLCRSCLDWSARKTHLAGSLGAALLDHILAKGWAKRIGGTREIRFTGTGSGVFAETFGLE